MSESWAISGVDLHLTPTGPRLRAGLEEALRDAIRGGRLTAGTRLPSSRALAHDLGVARNTVADAYGQLVAEGWLVARQGSGTRVAPVEPHGWAAGTEWPRAGGGPPAGAERTGADRGATPAGAERTGADRGATPAGATRTGGSGAPARLRFDLRPGRPDLAAFPRAAWLTAARRALAAAPYDALDYGDPRGRPELREALAAYLARARGVRAAPDRIVVVSGFTQGLALLCEVLRDDGARTLALEAHTLPSHRGHGLATRALPVDDRGADLDALGDVDAALLTPAHQFPLGRPLAPDRRAQAVAWGGLVIEDDYDGEFRYDRQPVGAMQALAPEQVVYAGTASKTLAPGVRLAWLVLPARLVDAVAAAKRRADHGSSALDQIALAELIASGAYDRVVRRARLAYRRRRDRLLATLARDAPHVRVAGIAAGLHALVELPRDGDERDVVARAAERGLALDGLDRYRIGGEPRGPALVVGYATPPAHAFTAALARLAAAL